VRQHWPEIPDSKETIATIALAFLIGWVSLRALFIFPYIFPEQGGPRLSGADSYFHLRHAEQVMEIFPKIMRWDPMTSFPHTERGLNQGLYDVMIAAFSKASLGLLGPTTILIWFSPLISGFACLMLAWWLARRATPWCGALFLGFMLMYPGPLKQIALLGNGDHHSFEVFLAVALVISLVECLKDKAPVWWAAAPALLLVAFALSWAGAPLHLFFTGLCLFFYPFTLREKESGKRLLLKGLVLAGTLAGLLTLAKIPYDGQYILWKEAHKVFLAGSACLAAGYPLLVPVAVRTPQKWRAVVSILALAGVYGLIALSSEASGYLNYFLAPRSEAIAEQARVSFQLIFTWYGVNWLALAVTPLLVWRSGRVRECALPLIYGLGLTFFWMYTRDFAYYAPVVIAACAAFAVQSIPWRSFTPYIVALLLAAPFFPWGLKTQPWLPSLDARQAVIHANGVDQAATWLRTYKEKYGQEQNYGLLAPWDLGNILAQQAKTPVGFSQTHSANLTKLFYSRKPEEVYEKIGTGEKPFRFVLIPSRNVEQKFTTEMQIGDPGIDPSSVYSPGPEIELDGKKYTLPKPNYRFQQIFLIQLFDRLAKGLGHYRLVFESPQKVIRAIRVKDDHKNFEFVALEVSDEEAEGLKPVLRIRNKLLETSRGLLFNPYLGTDTKVFEMVPGAVVYGKTKPRARVGVYISLKSPYYPEPRLIAWKSYADGEGNYEVRLPYSTGGAPYDIPGTVAPMGPYTVDLLGKKYQLDLTEEQVQSGARVEFQGAKKD